MDFPKLAKISASQHQQNLILPALDNKKWTFIAKIANTTTTSDRKKFSSCLRNPKVYVKNEFNLKKNFSSIRAKFIDTPDYENIICKTTTNRSGILYSHKTPTINNEFLNLQSNNELLLNKTVDNTLKNESLDTSALYEKIKQKLENEIQKQKKVRDLKIQMHSQISSKNVIHQHIKNKNLNNSALEAANIPMPNNTEVVHQLLANTHYKNFRARKCDALLSNIAKCIMIAYFYIQNKIKKKA